MGFIHMKDILCASFINYAYVLFIYLSVCGRKKSHVKYSTGTGRIQVCIFSLFAPQYLNQMDLEMVDQASTLEKHCAFDDKVTTNTLLSGEIFPNQIWLLHINIYCIRYRHVSEQNVINVFRQSPQEKIRQVSMLAAIKSEQIAVLDQELAEMEVAVAERQHIYDSTGRYSINQSALLTPEAHTRGVTTIKLS